jgi:hypothetical protein
MQLVRGTATVNPFKHFKINHINTETNLAHSHWFQLLSSYFRNRYTAQSIVTVQYRLRCKAKYFVYKSLITTHSPRKGPEYEISLGHLQQQVPKIKAGAGVEQHVTLNALYVCTANRD